MSLYYEAAEFLTSKDGADGSLTSRIYGNKALKSKPAQVYALVSESKKWSSVLSGIIETAGILKLERKLTPGLALVLSHDLLLAKGGVAASKDHVLKLAITRHKARLGAEFTKARLKAGFPTVEAWRTRLAVEAPEVLVADEKENGRKIFRHPRWVRVNTLKTNVDEQIAAGVFAGWTTAIPTVEELTQARGGQRLVIDKNIPNLVAAAPGSEFSKTDAYRRGKIILQDKASCFPAYLLNPGPSDGDIIDGCAAPGNKTTHLAALVQEARQNLGAHKHAHQTVYACERNPDRAKTLQKMVHVAGANEHRRVHILPGQDFSRLDPDDARWRDVGAILLDPSCSGSGMISRSDDADAESAVPLVLPRTGAALPVPPTSSRSKKRKRGGVQLAVPTATPLPTATNTTPSDDSDDSENENDTPLLPSDSNLTTRLIALSTFQLTLLLHAFRFPAARKVIYSTCSIHATENEHVVLRALSSSVAETRGWRVLRRDEQVEGLKGWSVRGDGAAVRDWVAEWRGGGDGVVDKGRRKEQGVHVGMSEREMEVVREACLRCEKGTGEGTMGFFCVGFVRDGGGGGGDGKYTDGGGEEEEEEDAAAVEDGKEEKEEEEEWAGLSSENEEE